MRSKKETCKNCEKQFKDKFKFCPYCGQQAKDELTVKVLFYNTISNYFSFDARFFKSFIPLLVKPGYLARKFIEGKRLLYLHPAQMYLFIAVVFFFLFSFIQRDQVRILDDGLAKTLSKEKTLDSDLVNQIKDSIVLNALANQKGQDSTELAEFKNSLNDFQVVLRDPKTPLDSLQLSKNNEGESFLDLVFNEKSVDSLIEIGAPNDAIYKEMGLEEGAGFLSRRVYEQSLKLYKSKKGGGLLQTFYDAIPISMFFLLPIFALILKLLYFKRGLYAHHLVFSFYFFSFIFMTFSIILGINFIWDVPDWIDFVVVLSTFVYLLLAVKHFYQQGWLMSILKTNITAFLFLLVVAPITVVVLGIFAFLFY
jgi:hypothetical protein